SRPRWANSSTAAAIPPLSPSSSGCASVCLPANSTASFNFTDAGFPAPAAKALSQQRLLLYSEHNEAGTLRGSDGGQMVRTRTILPGAARLRLGAATILLALFLSAPGAWALSELQG